MLPEKAALIDLDRRLPVSVIRVAQIVPFV
jgi:hypothetical protein